MSDTAATFAATDRAAADRDGADHDGAFSARLAAVLGLDDPVELMEQTYQGLTDLLGSGRNQPLLDELSIILGEVIGDLSFDAPEQVLRPQTRRTSHMCGELLRAAYEERSPDLAQDWPDAPIPPIAAPTAGSPPLPDEDADDDSEKSPDGDLQYRLPPHLAHLLRHMEITEPQPTDPTSGYGGFDALFQAAVFHRLDRVLTFFHRYNPDLSHELPPPFLLSPHFAERLKVAVATLIIPRIQSSRLIRVLASSINYSATDTSEFWDGLNSSSQHMISMAWNSAWDDLLLLETRRGEDRILQIKPDTRTLRDLLAPQSPDHYDIPKVGNTEILLLKSLLSITLDWWEPLNDLWRSCHILYEQEMDPRVFQQQAREGALRDHILKAVEQLPEHWSDFVILLCHRVYPRLNSVFLDRFTYNIGRDETERERRMPYVMRYLKQVRNCPSLRDRERRDEAKWQQQVKDLRLYLSGRTAADPLLGH